MKFYPQFSGVWYGMALSKGVPVDLTDEFQRKAENQPENFKKAGRKKSDAKDAD